MRLIDADRLEQVIHKAHFPEDDWDTENNASYALKLVRWQPTIEAEPVRNGRWIWKGDDKGWFCSECGGGCLLDTESDWFKSNGCPHCRAKMAGDET